MDGRLLARAREEKENIRNRAIAEDERRHAIAYTRAPELRRIDGALAGLVGRMVSAAMGDGPRPEKIREESLKLLARRAELLTENGLPMDWLDGAWACPDCRDTGYVMGEPCHCLLELYDRARAKDLSALLKLGSESFATFDLSYYDGVPGAREQMEIVFGFCRDYAESFGEDSVNLLFRGDTGLGKTFLSGCVARVVSQKGYSVVYETIVAALSAYEEQKFRGSEEAEERVRLLLDCDLLILDDLGTEMITEFTKSALYSLINSRLIGRKKTIISTNLTPEGLSRSYTPQIASRLLGEYQDLPFVGTDIRALRKERGLG